MNTSEVRKEVWVSKAQEEVWEWKEALSKQIENMTMLEAIHYIQEKSRTTVEEIKNAQKALPEKSTN